MTEWRHDEWCATLLDGAPESECDCVRKILMTLSTKLAVAGMRIISLDRAITAARTVDYGAFHNTRDYRDAVHKALDLDPEAEDNLE